MECDWSVEIGAGLPVIDGSWDGAVDLHASPSAVNTLDEAAKHPALREALLRLNAQNSPFVTSKCDVWTPAAEEIDPYEFAAMPDYALAGFASYIDVLVRDAKHFTSFPFHESYARGVISRLHKLDVHCGRIDLVIRAAIFEEKDGYGFTLYTAGCGANEASAYTAWQAVLAAAVTATIAAGIPD